MGCGASAGQNCEKQGTLETKDAGGSSDIAGDASSTTWATQCHTSPSAGSGAAASGGYRMGSQPQARGDMKEEMEIVDADDDEIEIIYEGKHNQNNNHANAQEPPDAVEPEPVANAAAARAKARAEAQAQAQAQTQAQISKRQKEAAKLAEQRKRFDNQKYQRERGADGEMSPLPMEMQPKPAEMVMGLNIAGVQANSSSAQSDDAGCLPGGIDDTPREKKVAQVRKSQNNHDLVDDADELLMSEILDSIEL